MSRPLTNPDEGVRARLDIRLSAAMRAHLQAIRERERLASLSDAVDWLIRQDRTRAT
jgi:hypothetical protein